VFWWFERHGHYLRCEVRGLTAGGYELRIIDPDGCEQVEHFDHASDLAKRQDVVVDEITSAGWSGPHGWVL
jgi:hypothetical protein